MKRALLCMIALALCFSASSGVCAVSYKMVAPVKEINIKLDETAVFRFDLSGTIPDDTIVSVKREKMICDLSWGESKPSSNGVVMYLNITGILPGETDLIVYVKDNEDIAVTVKVKVTNEPGIISFMGIPWDITPDEFDQALQTKGISFTKTKQSRRSDHWYRFDGMPSKPPYSSWIEIPSESSSYESSQNTEYKSYPLTKVAGYSVRRVSAEFKSSYSYEMKKIGPPYRLARASYIINESDIPKEMTIFEVYDDLTAKLVKLYGEPDGSEKSSDYIVERVWWYAEDGTGVSLKMKSIIGVRSITIEYGVADEETYLNNIYAIQQWEKQQVIDSLSDDVSGL